MALRTTERELTKRFHADTENCCKTILGTPEFRSWKLFGGTSVFLLVGGRDYGKSTICRWLIANGYFKINPDTRVCHHFFN